jgi:hypothetical protein
MNNQDIVTEMVNQMGLTPQMADQFQQQGTPQMPPSGGMQGMPQMQQGMPQMQQGMPQMQQGMPQMQQGMPQMQQTMPPMQQGGPSPEEQMRMMDAAQSGPSQLSQQIPAQQPSLGDIPLHEMLPQESPSSKLLNIPPPEDIRYESESSSTESTESEINLEKAGLGKPPKSWTETITDCIRDPIIVIVLYVIFNIPQVSDLLVRFLPAILKSNSYFILAIKALLIGISFMITKLVVA